MLSQAVIGAIIATLVGALISFVGLIVTKEAKVSEFRQEWINSLRSDLSTFLTNLTAVVGARDLPFNSRIEKFEKLQPYFSRLNESYYQIALRLNASETFSKQLQECIISLSEPVMGDAKIDMTAFERNRVVFISLSNKLLKEEWGRVKKGEPAFRYTRLFTALTVAALLLLTFLYFLQTV